MATRLPLALQTAYSDLVDKLLDAAVETQAREPGSFVPKTVDGKRYWYHQAKQSDGRYKQTYLGPDTPDLLARIERHRAIVDTIRARRDIVRSLVRSAAVPAPPARVGKILEALADSGVFRLRAVLVGTIAYQVYGPMLGVRLSGAALMTEDLDIAQFRSISIAVDDRVPPVLETLRKVEPEFQPVSKPLHEKTPISFLSTKEGRGGRKEQVKVEFLTPMRGPDEDAPGALPALGTGAQPLRFLDFLIYQEHKAAIMYGGGVLVNVPDPTRFALHKLIVSQRRTKLDKIRKDLVQAETLLDVLADERPHDIADTWAELGGPGRPNWPRIAMAGLNAIDPAVRNKVLDIIGPQPTDDETGTPPPPGR